MDNVMLVLERHDQSIKSVQKQMEDLKEVQNEIRNMNGTLIMLTTELKHINEHLISQEHKIEVIEALPKTRLNQIFSAIIGAVAGAAITVAVNLLIT